MHMQPQSYIHATGDCPIDAALLKEQLSHLVLPNLFRSLRGSCQSSSFHRPCTRFKFRFTTFHYTSTILNRAWMGAVPSPLSHVKGTRCYAAVTRPSVVRVSAVP